MSTVSLAINPASAAIFLPETSLTKVSSFNILTKNLPLNSASPKASTSLKYSKNMLACSAAKAVPGADVQKIQ